MGSRSLMLGVIVIMLALFGAFLVTVAATPSTGFDESNGNDCLTGENC